MLLGGALVAAACLLPPRANGPRPSAGASAVSGAAAAALGAVLLFGMTFRRFDKAAGALCVGWGVLVPWRQTIYDLQAIQQVLAGPVDAGEASRWQVVLQDAEVERLLLFELANETSARAAADEIAAFLALPVGRLAAPAAPTVAGDDDAAERRGDASPSQSLNV
jgi:hypothetical protein